MIGLTRDRARVPARFKAQKHLDNEALLTAQLPTDSFQFNAKIWGGAKPQLRREAGGKCAYCESLAETVAHCDVEHFRPKAKYWWLAYCYDNYLYACQICNQTHKSDKFPLAPQGRPLTPPQPGSRLGPEPTHAQAVQAFLVACQDERALFIDPYASDPEPLLKWTADEVLKEVRIEARARRGYPRKLAETTVAELGLNRADLLKWRYREYQTLRALRLALDALSGAARVPVVEEIRRRIAPAAPYAAMNRYFVNESWRLALP
jgi:hypothetical protein